jgi:hypothetical protein
MPFSQNGYTAGNEALLTTIDIPGGKLRVRKGPVAVIFAYLAARFDAEVEPVAGPVLDDWGYAYRDIRAGVSLSNHASGTAIDLNAMKHPLGKVGTFTAAQVRAIHAILADLDGTVRWGGDYSGRVDEMHFEINATAKQVTAVAQRIQEDSMPLSDDDIERIAERAAYKVWAYNQGGKTSQAWSFQKGIEAIVGRAVLANGLAYRNPKLSQVDVYQQLQDIHAAVTKPKETP